MRRFILLALLVMPLLSVAQTRIYKGRSTYSSDIVCTIDGHIPIPVLVMLL